MSKIDKIENSDFARGLGLDVVEIARVSIIINRTPNFCKRNYTDSEIEYCSRRYNSAAHFSTHFAAKEAALKALGIGIFDGVSLRDIEVVHDKSGKPSLKLHGRAMKIFEKQNIKQLLLSISFTSTDAVACVVSIYYDKPQHSLINTKDYENPTDIVTQQFKKLRNLV